MKKITKILIACVMAAVCAIALIACSENTKHSAVPTDVKDAKLTSNGGMAVKYGQYVYFINGYIGESASNVYGEVIRGAICRTTLDENGVPDYTKTQIIVPKNVYGEDKTYGGIYIVNDYIYYNTTSVEKDSKRNYKTTEGVLTRTSIDGSKTEIVKELDDNDISLYAGDNSKYLVYAYDKCLYTVNAKNNEIKHITESNAKEDKDKSKGYIDYKVCGDYVFFTQYNYAYESTYSKDYRVFMCDLTSGKVTLIASSDIYNGNDKREVLFTTTLIKAEDKGESILLYYSKKDNRTNATTYYCSLEISKADPKFDAAKETVYQFAGEYTDMYKLDNGYVLGLASKKFDIFNADGTKVKKAADSYDPNSESGNLMIEFDADITLVSLKETDTEVYIIYLSDKTFYYCKLFNKADGVYTVAKENIVKFSTVCFDTSYVTYDIIDGIIYYINDDMEYNAYYYVIPEFDNEKIDQDKLDEGKILGVVSEEDLFNMIAEEQADE